MPEIDHDRLFKELITEFFVEFLELFFPEVVTYIERDSMTFLDKEILTDVTQGETHLVDILVRARFQGQDAFFLIHIENQAKAQSDFNRRMFIYWARLFEKHGLPVYPIAVLSYAEPLRVEPEAFSVAFPDRTVLDFRFRTVQLNRLNWREFVDKPNPVASALMAKMRIAPAERWRVKLECLRLMATLQLNPAKMRMISGFVDTYLRLSREEELRFQAAVEAEIAPAQKEVVMEVVTSWMEQGIQQGMQQGVARGKVALLHRQLQQRFGGISAEGNQRLELLDESALDDFAVALLAFTNQAEAEAWLQERVPTA